MFSKQSPNKPTNNRLEDFSFLSDKDIYTDTACQSLRPLAVTKALEDYYHTYNACGGRVKYAWGQRVDEAVEQTRKDVLAFLKLPNKDYVTSFTLNTTYGINLLLQQLPQNSYKKIVTSEIEHNSVFLPTISAAKRLGIPRVVLERTQDGTLVYDKTDLTQAVVVVNAVSNIDGRKLLNIKNLIADTHAAGGIVIIDAAQAMAHSYELLQGLPADAICFSGHKMYGPSLGIVVATKKLLLALEDTIVGGGMVQSVSKETFVLLPEQELSSRLEPGLQAFGEIIAFGKALKWLQTIKPNGQKPADYLHDLSAMLFDGLKEIATIHMINSEPRPVISFYSDEHDAHRLAIFLSGVGIMARSGSFCCHYYLIEKQQSPPLVRLSLGLHSTKNDIAFVLETLRKLHPKGI